VLRGTRGGDLPQQKLGFKESPPLLSGTCFVLPYWLDLHEELAVSAGVLLNSVYSWISVRVFGVVAMLFRLCKG